MLRISHPHDPPLSHFVLNGDPTEKTQFKIIIHYIFKLCVRYIRVFLNNQNPVLLHFDSSALQQLYTQAILILVLHSG